MALSMGAMLFLLIPMFKSDEPFFGLVDIQLKNFPAGPFLICCGIFGGAGNYLVSGVVLSWMKLNRSDIQFGFGLAGVVVGITFALRFIVWLADKE